MMRIERALEKWTPTARVATRPRAQVLDFFSGCGGMSLGFSALAHSKHPFQLIGAIDIDARALTTYRDNFGVETHHQDIREMSRNRRDLGRFLAGLPGYVEDLPLVVVGCAPCQGFSGHRKKNWASDDARNSLVAVFARIATALNPACIIMENVPELLSGRYWHHFEAFRNELTDNGYVVKQTILNAATLGAPQERFRTIIMAMRNDKFQLPRPLLKVHQFRTVRDAIGDLPIVAAGKSSVGDAMHRSAAHRPGTLKTIRAVPKNGGSRPRGVGPACLDRVDGFYDVYGRLAWDKPAITITHYARNPASGRYTHPTQHRGLTMREAARLQGFPDSFAFSGSLDDVFRQIGEAVPPPMATAVAEATARNLLGVQLPGDDELVNEAVSSSYSGVIAGIKMRRR